MKLLFMDHHVILKNIIILSIYIYIYFFFNRKPKDKKPIFSPPNRKRHRLENIIQTQQDIMKHLDEYTKLKVFFILYFVI